MWLFKNKIQEPVKGTAEVLEIEGGSGLGGRYGGSAVWSSGRMKLMVTADGVPPTEVDWRGQIRCEYRPTLDQTFPITVDQANPHRISIKWTELPLREEVQREELQEMNAIADEIEHDADKTVEDARRLWRGLLERGEVTRERFDEEMRSLDEA